MRNAPARAYLKEVHDATTYWGSWLPGRTTRVGDCGPLKGVVFDNRENLGTDYHISFQSGPSDQYWRTIETASKADITIIPSVDATTLVGKQLVRIRFNRANRVLFGATTVRETSMLDRGSVAKQLDDLVRVGAFPPEYVVVTDVLRAARLTALVSRSKGEQVNVSLSLPVKTPVGPAILAPALEEAGSSQSTIKVVGGSRMTPLFRLMQPPRRPPETPGQRFRELWREQILTKIKGPNPPRIGYIKVSMNIGHGIALGRRIEIRPSPGQNISISSMNGQPVAISTEGWSPLSVEPLIVRGARQLLNDAIGGSIGDIELSKATPVEFVDAGYSAKREVHVRLMDDTPIVIEDPSGDLFIARPVAPVRIKVKQSDLRYVPKRATAPVEYVDFDAVYAAN